MSELCFQPAHILLPDASVPVSTWGCVACDQFTSDSEYWKNAERCAQEGPSTLRMIYPEVWLNEPDRAERIEKIHAAMEEYRKTILTRSVDGFVYVERTEQSGRIRQGLVGRIDLEAYSYRRGRLPEIRPSELTVESRIPARMEVRRGASLELPHVMMLADDPGRTLIEPVGKLRDSLPLLYEGELMMGGGHICGRAVEDPAVIESIEKAFRTLASREAFDAKYPEQAGARIMSLAVGDGNHSLAAAKACWEEIRETLTPEEIENHPARWCLAEVCNVHSDAIEIEPIHRVLFGTTAEKILLSLARWSNENMAGLRYGSQDEQSFIMVDSDAEYALGFESPTAPLTVGTLDEFLAEFLAENPNVSVDYVHDEPAVRALCKKKAAAFLLPPIPKGDIFRGVVLGGVRPRKTFSMGHAEEKRYYFECRSIR